MINLMKSNNKSQKYIYKQMRSKINFRQKIFSAISLNILPYFSLSKLLITINLSTTSIGWSLKGLFLFRFSYSNDFSQIIDLDRLLKDVSHIMLSTQLVKLISLESSYKSINWLSDFNHFILYFLIQSLYQFS